MAILFDPDVQILIDGAWISAVDVGNGVRQSQSIQISTGRTNWSSRTETGQCTFRLDNRDGRWSPDYASGAYSGDLKRNLPVRVGLSGGEVHVAAVPGDGDRVSTPDDNTLDITGDMDIRIEFELDRDLVDVFEGAQDSPLAYKSNGSNGWNWEIFNFLGEIHSSFDWFDSGAVARQYTTLNTSTPLPWNVHHERIGLRITFDADNGAADSEASFYWGPGVGGPWTLIGTDTGEGVTDILANTAQLNVAGNNFVANEDYVLFGRTYKFELRDGIDGTLVADPDFTAQTPGAASFVDSAGLTWTLGAGGELSDTQWRFHGELSSLPVRWSDVQGVDVTAPYEAAGLLRRLRQGNRVVISPLRRAINQTNNIVAYWPCEESGIRATQFAADINTAPMQVTAGGFCKAGTVDAFISSKPIADPAGTQWTADPDTYTPTLAEWQIRWLQSIPDTFTLGGTGDVLLEVTTTDMLWSVWFRDGTTGDMRVTAERGVSTVYDSGWVSFDATGKDMRMSLGVTDNGANVDVELVGQEADEPSAGGFSTSSAVAGDSGTVSRIRVNPDTAAEFDGIGIGHISLGDIVQSSGALTDALNSYDGETAGTRIARLCTENGIRTRTIGDPTLTEPMGPQPAGSLIELVEECAATDLGLLFESRDSVAVGYRTRESMVGQSPAVELDFSNGEVDRGPDLDRDDQRFRNSVLIESTFGSTALAEIDDGSALSISEPPVGAGLYDDRYAVNGQDDRLQFIADAVLALSSVDQPRVSNLGLALESTPMQANATLRQNVLDLRLGDLITVDNNLTVAIGTTQISQIVQGARETIGQYRHHIDLLTSPSSPWVAGGDLEAPGDTEPLDVSAVNSSTGVDPQAVTNPVQSTGNTLLAIAVATGPSNEAAAVWQAPPGSTQIFDYPGVDFVSRVRAWTLVDDGSASYTFGYDTGAGNACTCVLVGLTGEADSVVVTSSPVVAGGSTSTPYPTLTGTLADDLALAVGVGQVADEMTAGPSGYTEEFNNTPQIRGVAVHSTTATGTTVSPGNSTWDASAGAHIQWCAGFRGQGVATGGNNQLLTAGNWTVYVDPEDPDSFNENRSDGQLIVAGNRFQVGDDTDDINAGTGYGLSFDVNDEIQSFSQDSDTFRFGAKTVTGLNNTTTALVSRHVWLNDGSYDESQETAGGVNLSTTYPGIDRTYFDGTRTQLALIPTSAADPKAIQATESGEGGDRVLQSSVFRIEQWMLAADDNTASGGLHASGSAPSPWSCFIGDATLRIITRDQTTPWSTGNDNWTSNTRATVGISSLDVGEWWGLVYDYSVDPNDGHLYVWLNKNDGNGFQQIVNIDGGYGLAYADTDPNQDLFYAMLVQYYSWHRFTNDPVNAPNNWDDTYGDVRLMAFAYAGVIVAPSGIDVDDLFSHANYFLEG